jgi:hypothetical protein
MPSGIAGSLSDQEQGPGESLSVVSCASRPIIVFGCLEVNPERIRKAEIWGKGHGEETPGFVKSTLTPVIFHK